MGRRKAFVDVLISDGPDDASSDLWFHEDILTEGVSRKPPVVEKSAKIKVIRGSKSK